MIHDPTALTRPTHLDDEAAEMTAETVTEPRLPDDLESALARAGYRTMPCSLHHRHHEVWQGSDRRVFVGKAECIRRWLAEQMAAHYDRTDREELAPGRPTSEEPLDLVLAVEKAADTPPSRLAPGLEEVLARHACGERILADPLNEARASLQRAGALTIDLLITSRGWWLLQLIRDDKDSPSKGIASNALNQIHEYATRLAGLDAALLLIARRGLGIPRILESNGMLAELQRLEMVDGDRLITKRGWTHVRQLAAGDGPSAGIAQNLLNRFAPEEWGPDPIDDKAQGL